MKKPTSAKLGFFTQQFIETEQHVLEVTKTDVNQVRTVNGWRKSPQAHSTGFQTNSWEVFAHSQGDRSPFQLKLPPRLSVTACGKRASLAMQWRVFGVEPAATDACHGRAGG